MNTSVPSLAVNIQAWIMALNVSTTPGAPDAVFPIALLAVDNRPIPGDFNVSGCAAGQCYETSATFYKSACDPHCIAVPSIRPGPVLGSVWLSQFQITEDNREIARTPVVPVFHQNVDATVGPAVGVFDPSFFPIPNGW